MPESLLESIGGTAKRKERPSSNSSGKLFVLTLIGPKWFIGTHMEPPGGSQSHPNHTDKEWGEVWLRRKH